MREKAPWNLLSCCLIILLKMLAFLVNLARTANASNTNFIGNHAGKDVKVIFCRTPSTLLKKKKEIYMYIQHQHQVHFYNN